MSDVEATQRLGCTVTLTAGLRYARLDQAYGATVTRAAGGLEGLLSSDRDFTGLGPTFSVELQRPVGCGLSLLARARGSVVFGDCDKSYRTSNRFFDLNDSDVVMGIGEGELALEWARELASGSRLFVRGGYEGQLWHEAGSPNSPYGDLGFEGASVAFGFTR